MENVQLVKHEETIEFIYESREQREIHVKYMESQGWYAGSKIKRLKPEVSLLNATDEDREWYCEFYKRHA